MPRPKRRLGQAFWPSASGNPPVPPPSPRRAGVLHEGPALGRPVEDVRQPDGSGAGSVVIEEERKRQRNRRGEPVPYCRGSSAKLFEAASHPEQCKELLLADSRSVTSVGPVESRLKLWCDVSKRARLEPFRLTPDGIYSVMGAFKAAGYRSAMQYLDLAKQEHIHRGHAWSEQLALAYRVCSRSCKRALGPSKQASALPMDKVPTVAWDEAMVTNGPRDPVTATIVASWWLLREIEASHARIQHLTFDHESKTVAWLLPSSKTDVAALGATRKHACSCEVLSPQLCPYHSVLRLMGSRGPLEPVFVDINGAPPSKAGWADTFQAIARALGIPVCLANGARAFTGHSARATGAQYLAARGVELWRIQIFGRWDSDVILRYVREAPLSQLSELAIEAGHKDSLARARRELEALLRKARPSLAIPDADWCDELIGTEAPPPPSVPHDSSERLILNLSPGGKIHRCRTDLSVPSNALHPRHWKAYCSWPFARDHTLFRWVSNDCEGRRCQRCFPSARRTNSSASSASGSSESSYSSSSESS